MIENTLQLLQYSLIFLSLTYLVTKTPAFKSLLKNELLFKHRVYLVVFLVFFSILGNYFSTLVAVQEGKDVFANTRAIGAILAGLLGGPIIGFLVGLMGGMVRYSMSADPVMAVDYACTIATTFEGTFAGFVYYYLLKKGQLESFFINSKALLITFIVALIAEGFHMLLLVLIMEASTGWELVKQIAVPMLVANTFGVTMIMMLLKDNKANNENQGSHLKAWRIANKIAKKEIGFLTLGFNQQTSTRIAMIVKEEIGVGAVAITNTKKVLAFEGISDSSSVVGMPIQSKETLLAISSNKVIFNNKKIIDSDVFNKFGSVLVIPLQDADKKVMGTIKLYEPKNRLFLNINKNLGEDIAALLSNIILSTRLSAQKNLLVQAELERVSAQINPHFLFNSLNTIRSFTRTDPSTARDLLLHLSNLFRKNLNRSKKTMLTLKEELSHIQDYLIIEKARYPEQLQVNIDIPKELENYQLPIFTLQPLVENAIKHGTGEIMSPGVISIYSIISNENYQLFIEDNAGMYIKKENNSLGLGLDIVDKRIKNIYGDQFGLVITCQPKQWTKVMILLPNKKFNL